MKVAALEVKISVAHLAKALPSLPSTTTESDTLNTVPMWVASVYEIGGDADVASA